MHTRRVSLCEFRTLPDNTEGLAMAAEIGRGTPRRAVVEPRLEEEEVRCCCCRRRLEEEEEGTAARETPPWKRRRAAEVAIFFSRQQEKFVGCFSPTPLSTLTLARTGTPSLLCACACACACVGVCAGDKSFDFGISDRWRPQRAVGDHANASKEERIK